jgi:SAM-dependent methyltransferase
MRRRGPSTPAGKTLPLIRRWIALPPVDEQSGDLLDYGCGTGADVTHYRGVGLDAEGYDPHPPFGYADLPRRQFRIVMLIFVLSVLPTASERLEVLGRAASFLAPGGRLVVAARSASAIRDAARRGRWRVWGDGFVSHEGRSTFQHGMDDREIRELGAGVGLRPAEALPRVAGASLVAFTNDVDDSTAG